jgi:hypothetical protein
MEFAVAEKSVKEKAPGSVGTTDGKRISHRE